MAKSPAQRTREFRDRQRQALQGVVDATQRIQRDPFFKFYNDHGDKISVDIAMNTAGLPDLVFKDDNGPKSHDGEIERHYPDAYEGRERSIGRAEVVIGCLLDAAAELARIVNAYKREAIQREEDRLGELTGEATPEERKKILAELVKLNRLMDRLAEVDEAGKVVRERTIRRDISVYELKGN